MQLSQCEMYLIEIHMGYPHPHAGRTSC